MTTTIRGRRLRLCGGAALAVATNVALLAAPALAQIQGQAPTAAAPAGASENASENLTVNLMHLLVKQGVITQSAADQLMAEAQRETAEARAAGPGTAPIASNLPPPAAGVTRIPYVPEIVKNQIRDEVRQEVIQEAKTENWAQPNQIPEWTKRVTISGDVRLRYESDLYSHPSPTNANSGNAPDIVNYAALNANGPVDVNPNTNPSGVPILNTTRDRPDQLLIRARLDIAANPSDWVTADIRLASGSTNSPTSTSQLLGGGLTKKNIWLDRAYLDLHPNDSVGASFGRMPNPFFSTDLVYDYDLNFDGVAARGRFDLLPKHGVSLFGTIGAFLTDYQDPNFPDNDEQKSGYATKWMTGSQVGVNWKTDRFAWHTGLAYYSFDNSQGQLSAPCAIFAGVTQCSTDFSRPAFMQKGNTLFLIRNITPDPNAANGAFALPEYAGLVFPFRVLNLTSSFAFPLFTGKALELTGDYARNLAYNRQAICRYGEAGLPVTNIVVTNTVGDTDVCQPGSGAQVKSGPNAFMVRATYGDPEPFNFGQWNVELGYKHIAADAIPDAYTDADFHLGGTNAKGYFLIGTMGLYGGSNIQFRWFSADEVSGPPLSIDVGQIDLNAKF